MFVEPETTEYLEPKREAVCVQDVSEVRAQLIIADVMVSQSFASTKSVKTPAQTQVTY